MSGFLVLASAKEGNEDVNQTILRLSDTKDECRYVQDLVTVAHNTFDTADRLQEQSQAAEAGNDLRLAVTKMTQVTSTFLPRMIESWKAVASAIKTLAVKRGALPRCALPAQQESQQGVQKAVEKGQGYQQRLTDLQKRLNGR